MQQSQQQNGNLDPAVLQRMFTALQAMHDVWTDAAGRTYIQGRARAKQQLKEAAIEAGATWDDSQWDVDADIQMDGDEFWHKPRYIHLIGRVPISYSDIASAVDALLQQQGQQPQHAGQGPVQQQQHQHQQQHQQAVQGLMQQQQQQQQPMQEWMQQHQQLLQVFDVPAADDSCQACAHTHHTAEGHTVAQGAGHMQQEGGQQGSGEEEGRDEPVWISLQAWFKQEDCEGTVGIKEEATEEVVQLGSAGLQQQQPQQQPRHNVQETGSPARASAQVPESGADQAGLNTGVASVHATGNNPIVRHVAEAADLDDPTRAAKRRRLLAALSGPAQEGDMPPHHDSSQLRTGPYGAMTTIASAMLPSHTTLGGAAPAHNTQASITGAQAADLPASVAAPPRQLLTQQDVSIAGPSKLHSLVHLSELPELAWGNDGRVSLVTQLRANSALTKLLQELGCSAAIRRLPDVIRELSDPKPDVVARFVVAYAAVRNAAAAQDVQRAKDVLQQWLRE